MTSHAIRTNLVRSIGLAILLMSLAPRLMAQDLPDLEVDGLLRTGLRLESSRYDGVSGFEISRKRYRKRKATHKICRHCC